jgi:AcrR family transcriptional regulator
MAAYGVPNAYVVLIAYIVRCHYTVRMSSPAERRRTRRAAPRGGRAGSARGDAAAGGDVAPRDADDVARSFWSGVDLLWRESAAPAPRRTALDRERIVEAAIAIADAEGLDAVTMRRIARELGTGPMSLYRHVPDKEALKSLMIDGVLGAGELPGFGPGQWREGLQLLARESWALMRRHPWYPEAMQGTPPLTPRSVEGLDLALRLLDGYGLTILERMQIVHLVYSTVLAAAANAAIEDRSRAKLGLTDEEIFASFTPYFERIVESGSYPRVAELFASIGDEHFGNEEELMGAIELILDGVAVRIEAAGRRRASGRRRAAAGRRASARRG